MRIYKYKNLILNAVLIVVIITLVVISQNEEQTITIKEKECKPCEEIIVKEEKYVFADIKGEVKEEGVLKLPKGSRVIDFINKAGGFKKDANTININLSRVVEDQDVIYVFDDDFFEKEVLIEEVIIKEKCICPDVNYENCDIYEDLDEDTKLININEASIEELTTLPGIGEARAKDIIAYREENKFLKKEEIMEVSGIGEASYNNFKELITI